MNIFYIIHFIFLFDVFFLLRIFSTAFILFFYIIFLFTLLPTFAFYLYWYASSWSCNEK